MRVALPAGGEPPHDEVRPGVAGEERRLEEEEAGRPDRRGAAVPREELLSEDELHLEEQQRPEPDDPREHAVSLSAFMQRPPIVRLDRVSKDYREGEDSRHVLRETSATFAEGELVAIRGRSGSGKSTLLNLVAGIDLPTSGDVWVAGTCLSRLSPADRTLFRRDHLGFVFQFFNLIPTLTVLENVQLPAELGGRAPADAAARARALLAEVGLEGREHTFPDRLSGGEQQRVAVARALVQDPRLLLADEPTGNLDDATGQAVMALLDRVTRRAGRTLVLVTHSPQVAAMADRAFAIEDGHVVPLERLRRLRPA